jgi:hypothetical protein
MEFEDRPRFDTHVPYGKWKYRAPHDGVYSNHGLTAHLKEGEMFETSFLESTVRKLFEQREAIIMTQLQDLIQKGILVVELGEMVFIQHAYKAEIELHQAVKLTLRDKEYIEKLEQENADLINQINAVREIVSGMINQIRRSP